MSLYNKHRPKKFDDIVGNAASINAIKFRLMENKLPNALLFYGPSGTGKTTIARIIGLIVNCSNLENNVPCLKCSNCSSILSGNNPDFMEINAADIRGIDSIRSIIGKMMYSPTYLPNRVIILDEAHSLTNEAQNCLLKPLEEPPSNNYLMLCTTEPDKLLKTVRNRCDKHELSSLSNSERTRLVKSVLQKESVTLSDETIKAFTQECSSSPRDLLNQLDSLLSQEEPDSIETVMAVLNIFDEDVVDSTAINVARALAYKPNEVRNLAKNLEPGMNYEGYRRLILSYVKKCLLSAKDIKSEERFIKIIESFMSPLEYSAADLDFICRLYRLSK